MKYITYLESEEPPAVAEDETLIPLNKEDFILTRRLEEIRDQLKRLGMK